MKYTLIAVALLTVGCTKQVVIEPDMSNYVTKEELKSSIENPVDQVNSLSNRLKRVENTVNRREDACPCK